MKDKRLFIANLLLRLGCGPLARYTNRQRLIVFNYHRIRSDDTDTYPLFDEGVFGPNQQQFREQLLFLRKYSTVLGQDNLLDILAGARIGQGPYSMVTFDDAYIDNYRLALPVLRETGVPAIFFVPASVIEERDLGWWDKISYIVKNSPKSSVLFHGELLSFGGNKSESIEKLFNIVKLTPGVKPAEIIDELAEIAESPKPSKEIMDKELMTWEQLKEAHNSGVALGSHTCSHRVLATLSEQEQEMEIVGSKTFLENKLNIEIKTLAFPVGGLMHFNDTTINLVQKAGYGASFSFNTGSSLVQELDRYAVPRLGAPTDVRLFKSMLNFPKFMQFNSRDEHELKNSLY